MFRCLFPSLLTLGNFFYFRWFLHHHSIDDGHLHLPQFMSPYPFQFSNGFIVFKVEANALKVFVIKSPYGNHKILFLRFSIMYQITPLAQFILTLFASNQVTILYILKYFSKIVFPFDEDMYCRIVNESNIWVHIANTKWGRNTIICI